jgi:D-threitol dehydrogenase (NAD+)
MTSQVGYDFSLANKVAVVTGGASGIGAAIVDAYAVKGVTAVVLDKDVDSAQRKVNDGAAAAAFSCDVTSEQSVVDAVSTVKAHFGRIDILVNSAGVGVMGPAEDLAVDSWDLTMAVNLRGAFLVSQQVGRIMLAQGSGTVISMASQAATVALPGHLA